MKAKRITSILSLTLASALVPFVAAAFPKDGPRASHTAVMQSQQQQQYPSQSQSQSQQAQTFTGKVTKTGGKYALEDTSTNTTYYLDDSRAAQKYEGKTVKVTGTLDASNNTIHVEKIEQA